MTNGLRDRLAPVHLSIRHVFEHALIGFPLHPPRLPAAAPW
jgi:hypothetical protein